MSRVRVKEAIRNRRPDDIVRMVKHVPDFVKLFVRLLGDRRVSLFAKALFFAGAFYVLSPLDFLPDMAPILGQLDDLTLAAFAARLFIGLCPGPVVQEHVARIDQSGDWTPFAR